MSKKVIICLLILSILISSAFVGCSKTQTAAEVTENQDETTPAAVPVEQESASITDREDVAESNPEEQGIEPQTEQQAVQDIVEEVDEGKSDVAIDPTLQELYDIMGTEKEALYEVIEQRPSLSVPLCEQQETLSYWCGSTNLDFVIQSWSEQGGFAYLNELCNVNIEYIENPPPTMQEKFNLMVAGGDYSDILTDVMNYSITGSADWFVDEEIAIDLTDKIAECCPSYWYIVQNDPAYELFAWSEEGRVCGLVGSYCMYDYVKSGPTYRGDFLTELGMDIPLTIDDLHEYLLGCKQQGLCDSPLYMTYWGVESGSAILSAYGIRASLGDRANFSAFYLDENDQAHFGPTTDEFHDYLTLIHGWYEEGLIGDLYNSDICDAGDIANSAYAVYFSNANGEPEDVAHSTGDADFDLVGGYYPRLTEDQVLPCGYTTEYSLYFVVSTDCANPELALNWLDYRYSPNGSEIMQYGVPGLTYDYDENGAPYYTEFFLNNPDYSQTQMTQMYVNSGYGTVTDRRVDWLEGDDDLHQSVAVWAYNVEATNSSYLQYCAMNAEEGTIYGNAYSDMQTYGQECIAKFIVGDLDLETDWDEYVTVMEDFGVAECEQICTAAYDRYINKDIPQ